MRLRYLIIFLLRIIKCLCEEHGNSEHSDEYIILQSKEKIDYTTSNSNADKTMAQWMNKIESHLEKLDNNLQNIIPSVKDSIDLKFYKMNEKLEDYINTKLKLMNTELLNKIDENISIKLDMLEKKLPVAVQNISNKLDVLSKTIEDNCAKKCEFVDKYIPEFNENILNKTLAVLENKIPDNFTRSIDLKFESLSNNIPKLGANLTAKLHFLDKKIPENLNDKLELIQKKLPNIEEKLTAKLNVLEQLIPDMNETCKSFNNNNLEENLLNKLNSLYTLEEKILEKINTTQKNCTSLSDRCNKNLVVKGYNYSNFYSIDFKEFKHVTLLKDGDKIKLFEMNVAVISEREGIVLLTSKIFPKPDHVFEIVFGVGDNNHTDLRRKMMRDSVLHVNTPNILSVYKFTYLYIRILNGKLEVGYKGEAPFLTYNDLELNDVNYFSFASWNDKEAKFLFDCS